jgi:hypothetical protein
LFQPIIKKKPTTTPRISAHFEDKTAHAQVEVDETFFEEIVNRAYREGALLYLNDDTREKSSFEDLRTSFS